MACCQVPSEALHLSARGTHVCDLGLCDGLRVLVYSLSFCIIESRKLRSAEQLCLWAHGQTAGRKGRRVPEDSAFQGTAVAFRTASFFPSWDLCFLPSDKNTAGSRLTCLPHWHHSFNMASGSDSPQLRPDLSGSAFPLPPPRSTLSFCFMEVPGFRPPTPPPPLLAASIPGSQLPPSLRSPPVCA